MRPVHLGLMVLALSLVVAGLSCSGKDKPVKVEGMVTLDDRALAGAFVTFLPDEGGPGRVANGKTATDGSFSLSTPNEGDGALPGVYRVTITYIPANNDQSAPPQAKGDTGMTRADAIKMMAKMGAAGEALRKTMEKGPVPIAYANYLQTPLKEKVPPSGKVLLALRSDFVPIVRLEEPETMANRVSEKMPQKSQAEREPAKKDEPTKGKLADKAQPVKARPAEKVNPRNEKSAKP